MKINQTNSPAFAATFRTGNLKSEQKFVLNKVLSRLTPSREYKWAAERKFDIYFLKPTRSDGILRAVYYDNTMETFVRGNNGRLFETSARSSNPAAVNYQNIAERIQTALIDIIRGKYKAPYWYNDPNKYANEAENMRIAQEIEKINN